MFNLMCMRVHFYNKGTFNDDISIRLKQLDFNNRCRSGDATWCLISGRSVSTKTTVLDRRERNGRMDG